MDLKALWQGFTAGSSSAAWGLVFAGTALFAGLLFMAFALRPLVRVLSSPDTEKVRVARRRRIRFASNVAILAFASWSLLRAVTPAENRAHTLPYQLSLLLLIVMGGYVAVELLLTLFADFLPQKSGHPPISQFFKDVARTLALIGLFLVGIKMAFPTTDVGQLITTSAILSIVVGLALQESLSNVFSGLMLTIDQPYKPGEWIEIEGHEGKVLDSNWRSVRIWTRDDDVLYVPNSAMAGHLILNFSAPTPKHLIRRKIGVEYGAPPNKVKQVLVNMMSHVEGVLATPAPDVYVLDYADFAIIYDMRFWIENFDARTRIESEVMRNIWYHLKRNNIGIPFPIRDVYLRREKPEKRPEEIVALLRRVDILAPLKEEEQRMLADDLTSQLFGKGEVVCRQGEEGAVFYIIKSGRVSVHVKGAGGEEAEVAQLGAGAYFGEMSLLTGEPRTSTCKAAEDSELLVLDRESFGVLLRDNPPIAQTMSEVIASRQTASREKLAKERDTMVFNRSKDTEERKNKIFEAIRTIFRFR